MSDLHELFCDDVTEACSNCDGSGFVCENHPDKPWAPTSYRHDACECGAGMHCPHCYGDGEMVDQTNPESVRIKEKAKAESEMRYARQWAVEQVLRDEGYRGHSVTDQLRVAHLLAAFVIDGSAEEGSGKPAE